MSQARRHCWPVAIIAATACPLTTVADTIHVAPCGDDAWSGATTACVAPDGPKRTIQAAIDASLDGDVVLIADGVYTGPGNRDMDFGGRAITVRSENGSDECIIDIQGTEGDPARAFHFHSGETADSVVDGLTIRNGVTNRGGAVLCEAGSSPTFRDCTFERNAVLADLSDDGGGAVCNQESSPTFIDCRFNDNRVEGGDSGSSGGGAMTNQDDASPVITRCEFRSNAALGYGGAIQIRRGASAHVVASTFQDNQAREGGAVSVGRGARGAWLEQCELRGNRADAGGAVWLLGSHVTLVNCLLEGNDADSGGAVATGYLAHADIRNCVLAGNSGSSGSVIWILGLYNQGGTVAINNSIIWGNAVPNFWWGDQKEYIEAGYSCVEGGWPGDGNIDADPLFVDPDGPDDDPNTFEDNDYRLSGDSPCIDAADNTAVPADEFDLDGDGDTAERVPFDLDGKLRFADRQGTGDTGVADGSFPNLPIVDMGAYEYQCTGDLDGDGAVGLGDLSILLANFGTVGEATYADGDLGRDGDVDLADLSTLLDGFGTVCD